MSHHDKREASYFEPVRCPAAENTLQSTKNESAAENSPQDVQYLFKHLFIVFYKKRKEDKTKQTNKQALLANIQNT